MLAIWWHYSPMSLPSLADYHTHTPLCRHAEGEPLDYAKQARSLGLAEIGFSDHSPAQNDDFDDWRMRLSEFPHYLEKVAEARASVPEIPIRLGLEVDYLEGRGAAEWIETLSKMAKYDYLIGSVHYIAPGWDIDNPKWIGRWASSGEVDEIWTSYWEIYTRCIRSGFFDILAHPDLPKKFGYRPKVDLNRFYEPAIQAALDSDVVIEINTAGWRKECAEQYPARGFLELMHEAGVPLVISSDAHAPEEVGADFGRAAQLALSVGFTHTARFENRTRSLVPLIQNDA
jgi:histidinol-phosphatase (PHP family)